MSVKNLRNVAIVAHVDHGKTTLVDQLLKQSGTLNDRVSSGERMMDSNDLEKERGITILAKNTAIVWKEHRINIVDTPGHADFGGEVERILSMVDSVLLLVDAVDGPMPQTRFVTQKAFAHGLKPVVVINKVDRDGARPDWVVEQVFDLFDALGASDEQLDFPVIYASALQGFATHDLEEPSENMHALLDSLIDNVPPPAVQEEGPFQMQITSLDYSNYLGTIGIGRVHRGQIRSNTPVMVISRNGERSQGRVLTVMGYLGLERFEQGEARAGDIIAVSGIDGLFISDTLCSPTQVESLPPLVVDEPTVSITMQVNDSPLAGRDGKSITSRKIAERLEKELLHNVALKVFPGSSAEKFRICGRGELHLSILIENMRREGFELAISRPEVMTKTLDGVTLEPYENLSVDVQDNHQGSVMESLGKRQGELRDMLPDGRGRVRLDYRIPARGLIGFHTEFLSLTSGTGLSTHVFEDYAPLKPGVDNHRPKGVLIANAPGKATAYALWNLEARGQMIIAANEEVYEGMIIGIHNRDNDLVVNVIKGKQLTNIRAAGSDENIALTPPVVFSLEQAISFINDDELLEVTPNHLRIRKKHLKEHERKRADKNP